MSWFNIGLTIETIGVVLLGIVVLRVHWHVLKEHRIDADVMHTIKSEQWLGLMSIILIIIGYVIQLFG